MRITKEFVVLLAPLLVGGCYKPTENAEVQDLRGAATAKVASDGSIESRQPTPEELRMLELHSAKGDAVNKRFPPAPIPMGEPGIKANRVLPSGEIVLVDGRTIALDGVTCTEEGVLYLSRFVLGPEVKLIVVENGPVEAGKIPADVWTVETLEGGMKSYGFPVEAGITSGWCDPKSSRTSRFNERFAALAEAFSDERKATRRSAP